ncbi:hypothetical protein CTI12_AA281930 [Artemisia annua]|uniref:Uncharacterized protein n=1 Tax=Artemisia annua TaxID=35608 RepID=A0A2U1NCS8_ARTAN|nr:hypothetical protein CTI12_AA281930 [Artemisia annua]
MGFKHDIKYNAAVYGTRQLFKILRLQQRILCQDYQHTPEKMVIWVMNGCRRFHALFAKASGIFLFNVQGISGDTEFCSKLAKEEFVIFLGGPKKSYKSSMQPFDLIFVIVP